MLDAQETRTLLSNMTHSKDRVTKELGQVVWDMCQCDPFSDQFNMSTQIDTERCISILRTLQLRLQGYTHPGINGLEW